MSSKASTRCSGREIRLAFVASIPIILGYVALGIPCGVLAQQIGMTFWMVLLLSVLLYSGTGQYMIPGMYMTGSGPWGIGLSVALVCTRQLLYASALIPYLKDSKFITSFTFAANVTDESFAVNMQKFEEGEDPSRPSSTWSVQQARWVNIFSHASWTVSNLLGLLLSELVNIPTSVAAFAMTSIFLCLLFTQRGGSDIVAAGIMAMVGVVAAKLLGLGGVAIFIGACVGVAAGMIVHSVGKKPQETESHVIRPTHTSLLKTGSQIGSFFNDDIYEADMFRPDYWDVDLDEAWQMPEDSWADRGFEIE